MQQFLAVSNLTWQGLPPGVGRPADEQWFPTQEAATAWLKDKRCGGTISDGNRVIETIPAG